MHDLFFLSSLLVSNVLVLMYNLTRAVKEVAEMLVFVLLGVTILQDALKYDWFLISMTCLGCIIARALATVVLTFILNLLRPESDRISYKSQLVIWNAGLRGAVAYALAVSSSMPKVDMKKTNLMITTVHASVIFTILFHGMLTVPIVKLTGLAGLSRQLSEPRAARKKIHSIWSRLDKHYIIPFISFPRPSPPNEIVIDSDSDRGSDSMDRNDPLSGTRSAGRGAEAGAMELEERRGSLDDGELEIKGRLSYDGFDQNPNNLDTSLFEKRHTSPARSSSSSSGHSNDNNNDIKHDEDFAPRAVLRKPNAWREEEDDKGDAAQLKTATPAKLDMDANGHGVLLQRLYGNREEQPVTISFLSQDR